MICECGNITENKVCNQCGLILNEENIHNKQYVIHDEWDEEIVGGSIIKPSSPDLESHTVHSNWTTNRELKRAFRQEEYYSYNDNVYWEGNRKIKNICTLLELPTYIEEESLIVFKKLIKIRFFEEHHVREKSYGACVKMGCLIWNRPIQLNEIAKHTVASEDDIRNVFFIIRKKLNKNYKVNKISDILNIYSNKFNVTEKEKIELIKIGNIIDKIANTSGKSLFGYAAAILYLYLKPRVKITRNEVADIMDVTPHTITTRKSEVKKLWKKIK